MAAVAQRPRDTYYYVRNDRVHVIYMLMTPHAIKHTVLLHIDANGVAWHGCSLQCVFVMVCGEGEGAGGEWPGCALALCYFT